MRILIIIPTYNERENIANLLRSIFSVTKAENFSINILVVDDHSPDSTGTIVQNLMQTEFPKTVFLLTRPKKEGLGTAYIQGFRWGLQRNYQVLVEMDGDFSHNPRYLPQMVKNMDRFDCVMGSRYVPGGRIRGWGFFRKFISRAGSLYAKTILRIPIHDFTGGFNGWRREVLDNIGLADIKSEGYAFQIELKYRAASKGFRYHEFPIVFEDRFRGKSKISKKIILEAIYRVWQLKLKL